VMYMKRPRLWISSGSSPLAVRSRTAYGDSGADPLPGRLTTPQVELCHHCCSDYMAASYERVDRQSSGKVRYNQDVSAYISFFTSPIHLLTTTGES
jgi:hypothetical protein